MIVILCLLAVVAYLAVGIVTAVVALNVAGGGQVDAEDPMEVVGLTLLWPGAWALWISVWAGALIFVCVRSLDRAANKVFSKESNQ